MGSSRHTGTSWEVQVAHRAVREAERRRRSVSELSSEPEETDEDDSRQLQRLELLLENVDPKTAAGISSKDTSSEGTPYDTKRKRKSRRKASSTRALVKLSHTIPYALDIGANDGPPLLPTELPNDFLKEHLHGVLDILAEIAARESSRASHGKAFATSLMSTINSDPALLHTMLFTEMVYHRVQYGVAEQSLLEIKVGAEAIKHLNRQISDPEFALSDTNVWIALALAYSGRADHLRSTKVFPRQSFLRELQFIHIFCKMDIVMEHVIGLIKMIALIGGLDKLKSPGVAAVISFAGIMSACRTLSPPLFPFISHTSTFLQDGRLCITEEDRYALANETGDLGKGLQHVWSDLDSSIIHDLPSVVVDACDFTIVVESYIRGRWTPRQSSEIIDQRNYVQYSIMSLPSRQQLSEASRAAVDMQYESCRLALIVYSFLVIFPMPPVIGPFESLSEQLSQELQNFKLDDLSRDRLKLHFWVLFMGAVGSLGLEKYTWFVSRLRSCSEALGLESWTDARLILKSFLWHSSTSDPDGVRIWRAMQKEETATVGS